MGVEHIAQRVLCAGYTNNLSVDTLSIPPLYVEKSNTIHLSLNFPEMTPSSLQRSCKFELFISRLGHHLSFFLPTSIFSITHLLCFKNNILRGKCFYTVLISLLHVCLISASFSKGNHYLSGSKSVIHWTVLFSQNHRSVGSQESRAEGQNHIPHPAGHTAFNAAQDATGFWGCKHMLLGHVQLLTHQSSDLKVWWCLCFLILHSKGPEPNAFLKTMPFTYLFNIALPQRLLLGKINEVLKADWIGEAALTVWRVQMFLLDWTSTQDIKCYRLN